MIGEVKIWVNYDELTQEKYDAIFDSLRKIFIMNSDELTYLMREEEFTMRITPDQFTGLDILRTCFPNDVKIELV